MKTIKDLEAENKKAVEGCWRKVWKDSDKWIDRCGASLFICQRCVNTINHNKPIIATLKDVLGLIDELVIKGEGNLDPKKLKARIIGDKIPCVED